VLAIKNGVPALAVDPIAGGAKITTQARTMGWPVALAVSDASDDALDRAFEYCLSEKARQAAIEAGALAVRRLEQVRAEFRAAIAGTNSSPTLGT
jgi:hypothetical protein